MNVISYKAVVVCVAILFVTLNGFAQKQLPFIEHFDITNGLSSNIIICTMRDADGYLWIGTNDGLNKFNGRKFFSYFHKNKNNSSTVRNFISTVYEDHYGNIWVISNSDVLSFLNTDDKAHCFLEPKEIIIGDKIFSQQLGLKYFFEDAEKNLCIICKNNVVLKYNQKTNRFSKVELASNEKDSTASNRFLFVSKANGNIYFLKNKSGVCFYDSKKLTEHFIQDDLLKQFLVANEVAAIHLQTIGIDNSAEHILWILSTTGNFISFHIEKKICSKAYSVPGNEVKHYRAIGVDYENKIWISGNDGGALIFDMPKNRFEKYNQLFQSTYDFKPTELYNFYLDYENIFWIKTRSGLFKLDPNLNHFENFTIRNDKFENKGNINLSCFYKADKNTLLMGSNHGLFLYNEDSNKIQFLKPKHHSKTEKFSFIFKTGNTLFINCGGIQHYDIEKNLPTDIVCKSDTQTINRFFSSAIHSMLLDTLNGEKIWWMCSWNYNDLFIYNTKTQALQLVNVLPKEKNISTSALRGICKDAFGRIWIGSDNNGLICITDRNKMSFKIYSHNNNTNSIADNRITDLCRDSRGNIWLVTKTGVTLVNLKNNNPVFKNYGVLEGLHHQMTYDGLMDKKDNMWISSSAGLEKFDTKKLSFSHYGFGSGILNPQLATGKYFDDDGNFYFSSFHTFFRFNPDALVADSNPLKIKISNFTIMENDCTQVLDNPDLVLKHNENFISFQLEILTMTHSNSCKFKYKLHGLDKLWTQGADRDFVAYSALLPGEYKFEYNACNVDGDWNKSTKHFAFTILPPWYRTWWFYFAVATTLVLVVFAVVYFRIKRIKEREKLKLQVMVETQEEERKRIGRDLHDDVGAQLSTLKLFLNSMKDKEGNERNKLHAESMNMLTSSIGDIRNILINLSPKSLDEHGYVVAVEELVNRINKSNLLQFELSIHGFEDRLENKLENALYRITQELINNTLKYARAKKIILDVVRRGNIIVLMYEDDGIGCDLEKAKNGYGLTNIKTRAQMFNGAAHIDSSIGNGFRCEVSMSC